MKHCPWILVALLVGCGGGSYGYARSYQYAAHEQQYANRTHEVVYDEVRRLPDRFNDQMLGWFGVVTSIEPAPSGGSRVAMQLRIHQERHLCQDEPESSCRVTVSELDGGPFTAIVQLTPAELSGENRVQTGSLLKVYGTLVHGEYDAQGGPVLRAQFYRHWPRGEYVTTAARGTWLR